MYLQTLKMSNSSGDIKIAARHICRFYHVMELKLTTVYRAVDQDTQGADDIL
jgi:hypothetical protein